ncbi:MAG: DUF1820 family protein [Thermoanaerobaculaceae bacterium]|jgi:hypothetical protein|nr:DUF1820 family protein [Thermoanaerobaculaceae bacterium]
MPRPKTTTRVYKVIFSNQGQVFEIYARHVGQGEMFGFVEVEQILFGERSQLIVDASEEKLKTEFAGVKRAFIPLHSVVRIDEVEKEGAARISTPESASSSPRVLPIPMPIPGLKNEPR